MLSVTVQPFICLGDDEADRDRAQALRDGVLAGLFRLDGVRVYAGETSQAPSCALDYQLRGTLQRSGATLRVTAQLFDGTDGAHVWSDTFDGCDESAARLQFQDEVSCRIAASAARHVFAASGRRSPRRLGAIPVNQSLIQAIAADFRPQSLDGLLEQELLLRQSIEREPENGDAHARLARAILLQAAQEHAGVERKNEAVRVGAAFVERALLLAPQNARAHLAASYLNMLEGDFARCARSAERALMLDRYFPMAYNMLATALAHLGQGEAAISAAETAVRLDPAGPQLDVFETTLGLSRLLAGDADGALACFARARAANPKLPRAHGWAAITLGIKGEIEPARRAVSDLLRVAPQYRLTRSVDGCSHLSTPEYRRLFEALVARGAVAAGVPL